ncbi:MAG: type II toxin-antitoxin system VapC family toxin [Chloroflexota bacterium]|nr:type II toxin-antitoxin system VapC family toxin [Chloroflexota bacterium]
MNVYLDSSIVLRIALGEPAALRDWSNITNPVSSELTRIECLRTIDRARVQRRLDEPAVSRVRADLLRTIDTFTLIELDGAVKARAAEPFPTLLRTLDAIHLASALLARERIEGLLFATHDRELEIAARSMGFEVLA